MFDAKLMEVGAALVKGCNEGKAVENLDVLYAEDAVSVEAAAMPGGDGRETKGVAGIKGKHDWWDNAHETHSAKAEGPYFHGDDTFSVIFEADVTTRESGERVQMKEVGVYTVKDGKIVREAFHWSPQG